ncbi:MAG TPA: N-succinylarginine dihydrolase [Candidatus Tectomicrobia bacterium]
MKRTGQEIQLDGIVGPTHHFGGLSFGNVASMQHAGWHSHPRQAARQGLAKMRQVLELGLVQAVLPPLPRPDVCFLRRAGFSGSDTEVLAKAIARAPYLVSLAMSSAFMWTANAATVIPSRDSADGRCHVIVANLLATPHRALEGPARATMLRRLFRNAHLVVVHDPLPANPALSDEGAANHCRFATSQANRGWHLFVYGRAHDTPKRDLPRTFPARQSREASLAVARLGQLRPGRGLFVRQQACAIDAGAFHNDVVMVNDGNRLLLHEQCLVEQETVLQQLRQHLPTLRVHQVRQRDLSLRQAVQSYLFNSQLLHAPQGNVLLAPLQSSSGPPVKVIQRLLDEGFVDRVVFQDLSQSMAGGGGPACLRLRLPLTAQELATLTPGVILDTAKVQRLEAWVDQHYRDELTPRALADPALLREAQQALDALTQILDLGAIYPFQQ